MDVLQLRDKTSVTWQAAPFSSRVFRAAMPQGLTCAEIVAQVPDLNTRYFLQQGVLCINGQVVPREMWPLVRPKSREDIFVTLHMPIRGGGGGGSAKDALRIVAAIALVVAATAISGGALGPQGLALLGETFAAGTIGAQILAGAVTIGGALLLGAFVKPPAQKVAEAKKEEEGSAASLQGNQLKRGAAIPRVVGTLRAFPPFLAQPLVDLDGYDEVVEATYGFAGPHQLRDIRFGEVLADEIDPEQLDYQFYELIPGEGGIDENVQLMVPFAGEQDSVRFVDTSQYGRPFTVTGTPFLDKRAGYIGLTAGYFPGTGSFISTPTVPGFALLDRDWQIDFFFEFDGTVGSQFEICGQFSPVSDPATSSFTAFMAATGQMVLIVSDGTGFTQIVSDGVYTSGRHHYIGRRVGNLLELYIDEVLVDSTAFTGTIPGTSITFCVGSRGGDLAVNNWQGWVNQLRFTVGSTWDVATPQVAHKPAEPNLITRYGKSGQPNILMSDFRIKNEEDTQTTRDRLSNQGTPQRSLPQAQSVVVRGRNFNEAWVTLTFSAGLFYSDTDFDEDWFFSIPFRIRVRQLGEETWFNLPEVHIHDRRNAPFSRMLVFRWDGDTVMPNGVPDVVPPQQKCWRAAYTTVPVQTVTPTGIGGWSADSHFHAGTGDTYVTSENFSTSGVRNVRLTEDRVEFFLNDLIERGPIEVEVRRGQLYVADEFTYSSYSLNTDPPADDLANGVYDLFGYASLEGFNVIVLKQSNSANQVVISRTSAVWNQPPIARKGQFAAIYVRIKGRTLDALSALASGLVADWDGSEWTGLNATSNPAPHYRDVLIGDLNDNRIEEDMVDDTVLLEWRQRCFDLQFECNAAFNGENVDRVLEVIASCGYARPRQAEVWDVAQDRDFSAIAPVQLFTPRNMRNFRWEKAFIRHRPDGLRVRYSDASDDYIERTLVIPRLDIIGAEPARLEEIRYDGLVTEEEVVLKALYDQQQVIDRFTFYYGEVDAEQLVCRRGDLVLVQHDTLDHFAGFSRVLDVEIEDGFVSSIELDGSVAPTDAFFEVDTAPPFFMTPTEFFTNDVGVAIRLKDGSMVTFEASVQDGGFTLVPHITLENVDADLLERECLVSTGRLLSANRRMLLFDVRPRADLVADVTFVDEAPQLWQFPEPLQVSEEFMRNRIINGDMRLDQRNEGTALNIPDGGADTFTLDRWSAFNADTAGASTSRFSIQQVDDDDPPPGFTHYARATVTNALTPLASGDGYGFSYKIPLETFKEIDWDRSTARQMALSFVVRASVTGTYTGRVYLAQSGLSYIFTYTIPVADTWIRRIVNIPPPSGATFGSDPDAHGRIEWSLGLGSSFLTSSNLNKWFTSAGGATRGATGQTNLIETAAATWDITGVQFEIAPATVFEWLPIALQEEMAFQYCQVLRAAELSNGSRLGTGLCHSTTLAEINIPLTVKMKRLPDVTISNPTDFALSVPAFGFIATTSIDVPSPGVNSQTSLDIVATVAAGLTAGHGVVFGFGTGAATYIMAEAEIN